MNKQRLIATAVTLIILSGILGGVCYLYEKNHIKQPLIIDNASKNSEVTSTPVIVGWKTYSDAQFHYSIDYPSNWLFTEYPNAVGGVFYSLSSQNANSPGSITVTEAGRGLTDCGIPFPEYMKIVAIHNIENYDRLNSLVEVVTKNDLIGYTSTWITSNLQGATNTLPTPPMTYFEDSSQACSNGTGMVEIILNGGSNGGNISQDFDVSIYNQMVSSFRFTQ